MQIRLSPICSTSGTSNYPIGINGRTPGLHRTDHSGLPTQCGSEFERNAPMFAEGMRGFSVIEVLIVSVVILFVSGFALVQIARARDISIRNNSARELTGYLEKARLDSIRRHATVTSQMAQVTILNDSYYTIAIDSDGNGTLDTPRVINLPPNSNLRLNGPFPRSILFNWRGRTIDSSGNPTTPSAITISNGYGVTTINMSQGGQPTVDVMPQTDPISNSTAPAATFRNQTQIP